MPAGNPQWRDRQSGRNRTVYEVRRASIAGGSPVSCHAQPTAHREARGYRAARAMEFRVLAMLALHAGESVSAELAYDGRMTAPAPRVRHHCAGRPRNAGPPDMP